MTIAIIHILKKSYAHAPLTLVDNNFTYNISGHGKRGKYSSLMTLLSMKYGKMLNRFDL